MRHETSDRLLTLASWTCALAAVLVPLSMVVYLSIEGIGALSWGFLTDRPRGVPPGTQGGILPAILGSLSLVGIGLLTAVPLGVGGAVFLSAYASSSFWKRLLRGAAECLAGVPSILYGLFGYAVLVVVFGLGVSLRAGGLTLGLMMFPIILIGVHEALAAVPSELSEAVEALGVTKAHALRRVLLRQAWPGIVAAISLAAGHAAGSAAPVLYTASIFYSPGGIRWQDPVMTLPTHLYHLAGEALSPRQAHGTALVLMGGLLLANALALVLKGEGPRMSLSILPQSRSVPGVSEAPRALEFRNVSAAYGRRNALWDVNGVFQDRRVTALLGPSGGGKSTLIKVANRTFELTPEARLVSGQVFLGGEPLYDRAMDPRSVRRSIGLIHQRPTAFPMSILENVLFGARFHNLLGPSRPEEYAQRYLERAGLWEEVKDRLRAPAASLSGGQLQRLCLARTLANQPRLILMDEPTSSLDPLSAAKIEQHVQELKREMAVAIVTHDPAQARRLADDVLFLAGGRLVESGPRETFFSAPRTPEAAAYLAGGLS